MSELFVPPYIPVHDPDGYHAWSARFRLPEPLPQADVLAELHRGVQAMKYAPQIPLKEIGAYGLSGVLIGPAGDDKASKVSGVIFYGDPSKKHGKREAADMDPQAVRIAELNNWDDVNMDGSEIPEDAEDIAPEGVTRVIMGLGKGQYGGSDSFTLAQARRLLAPGSYFTMSGGHHFSDRPTWPQIYHEPAAILTIDSVLYEHDSNVKPELFNLALGLDEQHRFTALTPQGVEVFERYIP